MHSSRGGAGPAHPLFGGAMSAAVPRGAVDVSDLREIPDNQEVFAHCHTDQSLVVELLEHQGQVADADAAEFHFDDVAGSNKALEPEALEVSGVEPLPVSELSLSQCSSAWVLTGAQLVSKFNEAARNTVALHLGLLRLPQFSTDLLVTFNDPLTISPESSSSIIPEEDSGGSGSAESPPEPWTVQDFHRLLRSLTLHDPGLFE